MYYIRYEKMGGAWYYMIYRQGWWGVHTFFERWNSPESAKVRLQELKDSK